MQPPARNIGRVLLVLAVLCTAAWTPRAVATQVAEVWVHPVLTSVDPGEVFEIAIQIQNVQNLYGLDLRLTFDPLRLSGESIDSGGFLPSPLFEAEKVIDNGLGEARYVAALMSPAPPASGSGVLLRLEFRALTAGTCPLGLNALLADASAAAIPATVTGGSAVIGGVAETPTATPSATTTRTAAATPTSTVTPTSTGTLTPLSASPTATRSATPSSTAPQTPVGHRMWLPVITRRDPTPTPTATRTATRTPTHTVTRTSTATATASRTATLSLTPLVSATPGATSSPTSSPTVSPTRTPSATPSTPTATLTPGTPTATRTPSATPSRTATPTVSPTPWQITILEQMLENPSFETDEGWAILQTAVPAGYSVSRSRTGLRSMRLGPVGPYPGIAYSSVEQEMDIAGDALQATLSLYYYPVSTGVDGDYLYVVLYRASDGLRLETITWMERQQTWLMKSIDLMPYAGQRLRVRIGLYNDGSGVSTVYLDDVEAWVGTPG